MVRSGTRMDLAMVKQEQGETHRKYMQRFFDNRATVVDVTDKEVIDLFQDGLYTSTILNINDQTVWSRYMQIWSRNTFL
jgi:hypothetical protein